MRKYIIELYGSVVSYSTFEVRYVYVLVREIGCKYQIDYRSCSNWSASLIIVPLKANHNFLVSKF